MKVNRLFNMGMVIMMLVTSFAVSQPVAAQAPVKFTPRIAPGAEAVPGEIVVAFADSQDKNLVEKIEQAVDTANDAGGEVTRLSMDGNAVIQVDGDAAAALTDLNNQPGVLYAELNYVYSVPQSEEPTDEYKASSDFVIREVTPSAGTNGMDAMAVPNSTIQGMVAMGTLPTDTYLQNDQGWFDIGADIVWPNATASANVCMIDTGVDYYHPDMSYTYSYRVRIRRNGVYVYVTRYATAYRTILGYDFVNGDGDPMDDNGHGTHLAGIMVAMKNNGIGVSGVSTGNVVAVKALDAQGTGTNFDIANAITYCANRTDVRVINLSLGSASDSVAVQNALLYATTPTNLIANDHNGVPTGVFGKGKLVVAAAGNGGQFLNKVYPAAYATQPNFPNNRILSVGATGKLLSGVTNYACKATFSNYGDWVTVAAPGYDIYSTTPYDKPFYQNYYDNVATRYDYMSGTSMAAAFVSSAAARRMGYKPLETNETVGTLIRTSGKAMNTTLGNCTPGEMASVKRVNIATLLDRAALRLSVFDAAAGIPLNGATVGVTFAFNGVTTLKTAVIAPDTFRPLAGEDPDPTRVYTNYISVVDILDVPTVNSVSGAPVTNYLVYVNKPGYTNGYQNIFREDNLSTLTAGSFTVLTNGAVPPLNSQFNVVLGWHKWQQNGYKVATSLDDLDLYVWLPQQGAPTSQSGQPSFIVGYGGNSFGFIEGDSYGTMTQFPFARLKREGGFVDGGPLVETIAISQGANINLPYYYGRYSILATDYGQTIDHDNDGCGDNYGSTFKPVGVGVGYYDPATDADCPPGDATGTLGIPLLGAYYTPFVYVWKDGVVKYFQSSENNFAPWTAELTSDPAKCNDHWWRASEIFTQIGYTLPTYTAYGAPNAPLCGHGSEGTIIPYTGYADADPTDRIYITGLGK